MTGELTFPRPFSGIVRLMVMQLDLPFPNCRHLQFGWRLLDFTDRSDGVCTENSNPDVVMVKPAEDRV
jgi:hypothetical protein